MTPPPPRVAFFTTLRHNVGDDFIREGVRAILEACGVAHTPLYISKHDEASLRESREDETDVVSDKYWEADLVVVAGAPFYWYWRGRAGRTHRSVDAPWQKWFLADRALSPRLDHPPLLVLGAGAGFDWADDGSAFISDPQCAAFARAVAERALLTTVRDPLASSILTRLGVDHRLLPCPAFLAALRAPPAALAGTPGPAIGVNLMPLAGHNDLDPQFDRAGWPGVCAGLLAELRTLGPLVLIAHNAGEEAFLRSLAAPSERVFHSADWSDYAAAYAACRLVAANRVHGAVYAAGFGVPSLLLGKDSRARIAELLGIPVERASTLDPAHAATIARDLLARHDQERARLLALRAHTTDQYRRVLIPFLAPPRSAQAGTAP